MTPELYYLTLVIAMTSIFWFPYGFINKILVRGIMGAVGYPQEPKPLSAWAERMKLAHYNAIENLVIFAPLVIIAHLLNIHTEMTVLACVIYFWGRLVHFLAYVFAVPFVRTLGFAAGFVAQVILIWQICVAASAVAVVVVG